MGAIASQITSLTIICSTVYSGADQRKHQSSASLAFVWGIHLWLMNSPYKGPVTRKMFPFDDIIMKRRSRKCRLSKFSCENDRFNTGYLDGDDGWPPQIGLKSWCRHQMESFSTLLALCAGNSPVTGEFSSQRPVARSFDIYFDLRLNYNWANNGNTGDLGRHRAHYDVTVICSSDVFLLRFWEFISHYGMSLTRISICKRDIH